MWLFDVEARTRAAKVAGSLTVIEELLVDARSSPPTPSVIDSEIDPLEEVASIGPFTDSAVIWLLDVCR